MRVQDESDVTNESGDDVDKDEDKEGEKRTRKTKTKNNNKKTKNKMEKHSGKSPDKERRSGRLSLRVPRVALSEPRC